MNNDEKRRFFQKVKSMSSEKFWHVQNIFHTRAYAAAERIYWQAMDDLLTPEQKAAVIARATEIRISEGMVTVTTDKTEAELFHPMEEDESNMGTPIPSRENELKGKGAGEVTVRTLTPEEMEQEFERMSSKGRLAAPTTQKQIEAKNQNPKSEGETEMQRRRGATPKQGPACGLTKIDLLKAIAQGETLSSIEKAWGMKYNTIHDWVKRWGLKGITPEKAQELLNAEASARQSEAEGNHSADPADAAVPEIPADVVLEETAVAAEQSAVNTLPVQPYITIRLPLVNLGYDRVKMLAGIDVIANQVDTSAIVPKELTLEALGLMQTVTSIVYQKVSEVSRPDRVLEVLQEFFTDRNEEHLEIVEGLIKQ
ncbi:helix-turn-helix domain-containing protein [Paenibacillus thailandensis]|uniref:Helix-turn-helix domain-containing protein n=1 Tax=Paenibacillus thailandensis TaxID=393250 RepID=A0ABW5R2H2_9BACL